MIYTKRADKYSKIEISKFKNNNTGEINLIVKPSEAATFDKELEKVLSSVQFYLDEEKLPAQSIAFMRFFVSDYANQECIWGILGDEKYIDFANCAVSVVQQPVVDNSKVALWLYLINDESEKNPIKLKETSGELILNRNLYQHIWSTHLTTSNGASESAKQTENIFNEYSRSLESKGFKLKNNCIRTWLFVRDVDFNYHGVVEARKELFGKLGMTKDTHFITSTGIEGRHFNANKNVLMDAYSVGGISPEQIKFLEAPDNLNPTHEYGVTFERGTSVDYGDRRHVFISGTASIDNKGEVVHRQDVKKQILRTFENIKALLADADSDIYDVAQMIVYIRDIADKDLVNDFFKQNYQEIPKVIVLAPVCRPEWLIEIECIAIKRIEKSEFACF